MFLYLSSSLCQHHSNGWGHPENAQRIIRIEQALTEALLLSNTLHKDIMPATEEDVFRVHSSSFWETLKKHLPENGFVKIDEDTSLNPGSLESALTASGAMLTAIDAIMNQEAGQAFCNVRPPGHHAERNRPMGFCLINHIAIGAAYALEKYALERIVIVDFDVHHGNGTEDYVRHEARVGYVSSFEDGIFPFTDPISDLNNMSKLPLPAQSDGQAFMDAWQQKGFEFIRHFKPQLILISAGFDAHKADPLANLNLTEQDFYHWTQQLMTLANEVCDGKVISILEGGYELKALSDSATAHVKALRAL
ncbi:Histone deacetylase-like amidohydrolase [Hydrogenovibrio crunogenus]|uniref:Histone deacetylase-like amidohydrolase n=1 Tax=Hydrogenovibrio crunogenus TaxID=39765 RepID=A0A4P7NYP9_9GAMM|nr:histone deacetylase family protein [Hydrogenovibrio crunogenus]QBZ82877.1 Histone deacetylase-like amidohydrolase [Hydrogenovibrio crunogenus]RUM90666.1 MAG: histone deacetylase family protein [Thiomicrospira sp.]